MKGSKTATNSDRVEYVAEVTRAKEIKEGNVGFDMKVNGVSISGCFYREGVKDGKEWSLISFPSEKGKDGKYYNKVWFPMSKEVKEDIVSQLEKMV